jgi:hypothetical protein
MAPALLRRGHFYSWPSTSYSKATPSGSVFSNQVSAASALAVHVLGVANLLAGIDIGPNGGSQRSSVRALEKRMTHFPFGRFGTALDFGQQLRLYPDSPVRDPLGIGLSFSDQRRQARRPRWRPALNCETKKAKSEK